MEKYYLILQINRGASKDEIKKAFRKMAHIYHPDKPGGNAEKFKEIKIAYDALTTDSYVEETTTYKDNSSTVTYSAWTQYNYEPNRNDFWRQANDMNAQKARDFQEAVDRMAQAMQQDKSARQALREEMLRRMMGL